MFTLVYVIIDANGFLGMRGVASYHFPANAGFACTPSSPLTSVGGSASSRESVVILALFIRRLAAYEEGIVRLIRDHVLVEMPYIS